MARCDSAARGVLRGFSAGSPARPLSAARPPAFEVAERQRRRQCVVGVIGVPGAAAWTSRTASSTRAAPRRLVDASATRASRPMSVTTNRATYPPSPGGGSGGTEMRLRPPVQAAAPPDRAWRHRSHSTTGWSGGAGPSRVAADEPGVGAERLELAQEILVAAADDADPLQGRASLGSQRRDDVRETAP